MGTLAIEHSNIRHVAPHFLYLNSGFGYTLYVRFASKKSAMISKGMLQTNKKSKKHRIKNDFGAAYNKFIHKNRSETVLLDGADLELVYHAGNVDFERVDCA